MWFKSLPRNGVVLAAEGFMTWVFPAPAVGGSLTSPGWDFLCLSGEILGSIYHHKSSDIPTRHFTQIIYEQFVAFAESSLL